MSGREPQPHPHGSAHQTVSEIAAATPPSRDRYVDFVRVVSLAVVIIGHFLMAVVYIDDRPEGGAEINYANILSIAPWTRPVTWVLQVMPMFFVVGGFAHAVSLRSLQKRGGGFADFVSMRIARLVKPALVYIGCGLFLGLVVDSLFQGQHGSARIMGLAGQLLWFIGVYLVAALCAPLVLKLHRRAGVWGLVILIGAAALVDILRLGFDIGGVALLNFLFVWLAIHQLGFFYADGVADKIGPQKLGWSMVVVGAIASVLLVKVGPYGATLVSYDGEVLSNLTPPTVVLISFGITQAGFLLVVRGAVRRWLDQPKVWVGVIAAGSVAMTAYLWQMVALISAYLVAFAFEWPVFTDQLSLRWWMWHVPIFAIFAGFLALFVNIFRRWDKPPPNPYLVGPSRIRGTVAALGAIFSIVGTLGFAAVGFRGVASGYIAEIEGVRISAVGSGITVLLGSILVAIAVARPRSRKQALAAAAPQNEARPASTAAADTASTSADAGRSA